MDRHTESNARAPDLQRELGGGVTGGRDSLLTLGGLGYICLPLVTGTMRTMSLLGNGKYTEALVCATTSALCTMMLAFAGYVVKKLSLMLKKGQVNGNDLPPQTQCPLPCLAKALTKILGILHIRRNG